MLGWYLRAGSAETGEDLTPSHGGLYSILMLGWYCGAGSAETGEDLTPPHGGLPVCGQQRHPTLRQQRIFHQSTV